MFSCNRLRLLAPKGLIRTRLGDIELSNICTDPPDDSEDAST